MDSMTTTQSSELVPEWTQGDRLRKARAMTGMNVREFAEHIGVSHGTITNAENDARAVRPITMKAWAMATGVSLEWLKTGQAPSSPSPTPPGERNEAALRALTEAKRARVRSTRGGSTTAGYVTVADAA